MATAASCEPARVECRWKPLREGEMSPFKMLVALLMREVYLAAGDARKAGEDKQFSISPQTLLLLYKLITVL